MTNLLRARGLGCRDNGRWRVAGLDLDLAAGEAVGLLGTNGAGKSTTLALLAGALVPTEGSVEVLGEDLHRGPRRVRRALGLLPEQPPLHPDLTVDENLAFAARLRGLGRAEAAAACRRARRRCDIDRLGRRLAQRLSRGEAQRAALALAIVHDPRVLLLDEPTAGLDPLQAAGLHELVRQLLDDRAVLLSTHLLPDVEALCGRVVVLHEGRPAAVPAAAGDARRVRVAFSSAVAATDLAAVPGVLAAHRDGPDAWVLELDPRAPADLAERLAGRGWGLRGYAPVRRDLAALFADLATRGNAG
jgi:ABC-2 type transport system ATP-binding protein